MSTWSTRGQPGSATTRSPRSPTATMRGARRSGAVARRRRAARGCDVGDATLGRARAHYDPPALVEILFVVGQYTMLSMVANAAGHRRRRQGSSRSRSTGMTVGVAVVGTGFGCLTHVHACAPRASTCTHSLDAIREKTAEPGAAVRESARRVHVHGRSAGPPRRRRGDDRDAAAHARGPRLRGDRGRQARAVREAVHPRRGRGPARCSMPPNGPASCTSSAPRCASPRARRCSPASSRDGAIGEPRLATFLMHIPLLADAASEVPAWWSDADAGGGWLGAHARRT